MNEDIKAATLLLNIDVTDIAIPYDINRCHVAAPEDDDSQGKGREHEEADDPS
jgi:hypothetical protein